MNEQEITIVKIEAEPYLDPYQRGTGQFTRTQIWIDPGVREVWVDQRMQSNSWPVDEWNYLIRRFILSSYPTEDDLRALLDSYMDYFATICEGFESVWDGNNHVGHYTEDAWTVIQRLEREFYDYYTDNAYEVASIYDWLRDWKHDTVRFNTSDEELAELAAEMEQYVTENNVILDDDDILGHLTEYRDQERDEYDAEIEYQAQLAREIDEAQATPAQHELK